ncbi:major capsid protein [Dipodfec virus UOA04_Rod_881]|nr:major capsid protein [Dipodfec virus UOA04_Rod_881]
MARIPLVPNSRIKLDIRALFRVLTASAPILNGYRIRVSSFFVPYRLYVPELRLNEATVVNDFSDAILPRIQIPAVFPSTTSGLSAGGSSVAAPRMVAPGSLWNCVGMPVGYFSPLTPGTPTNTSTTATWPQSSTPELLRGIDFLSYVDIYRNYFMNTASSYSIIVRANAGSATVTAGGSPWQNPGLFSLSNSTLERGFVEMVRSFESASSTRSFEYRDLLGTSFDERFFISCPNGGLFAKSLPLDIVNARIENTRYAEAISRSMVEVSGGKLNMQDLVDGRRLYDYFIKAAYTVRFDQWIKAEYGIDISKHLDIPMLLRTWSTDINFEALYGTATASNDDSQTSYLGSQVGTAAGMSNAWRLNYRAQEYGDVVFILSVEPDVVYTKTLDPALEKTVFSDMFTPSFDRMGAQGVPQSRINALRRGVGVAGFSYVSAPFYSSRSFPVGYYTGTSFTERNVGYQPSWSEYVYPYSSAIGSISDPTNSLRTWISSPYYGDGPVSSYFPNSDASSITNLYDSVHSVPTDYLVQFPDTTAGSQPFLIGLNFRGSLFAPISSNQISKL